MNVEVIVWVIPLLCSVLRHLGLRQYLSIAAQNLSSYNPVREAVQPGIVGAVDDSFTVHLKKPAQIQAHADEQSRKGIGNPQNIFI